MDSASLAGTLEGKLAAIRDAGFAQVMISAADVVGHPQGTAAGVRAVRASGLRVTGLEALRDFPGLDGALHAYKLDVAKAMLDLCDALGSRLLLVESSALPQASRAPESIVRDLRKLALLALPLRIRIAYKATPTLRSPQTLAAAIDAVFDADCRNLGLAIDAFDVLAAHVGADDLDALDPDQLLLVQLSDFMWKDLASVEERDSTASHFRVFPGEGVHSEALAQLVTRLDRMGYRGDYSFDVYNDDYLQLPPEFVAGRARRAALWLGETVLRRALPVPNLERLRSAS